MAERLEQLLEPGEEVVYRAPRRWEPNSWFAEGSVYVISIALAVLSGLIGFDWAGAACVGAAFAGVWAFTLHCYVRDWAREALVTDRRLLHRDGWRKPKLTEVAAGEVRKVEAYKDRLRITRNDGSRLDLGHPHEAWGCGVALAHVAGLAPPRLVTRGEVAADYLWMLACTVAGLAVALVPLTWLLGAYMAGDFSMWLAPFIGIFIFVGWFAHAIGMQIGTLLAMVLLRPYLRYRELLDWIDHSTVFWPPASMPDRTDPCAARCKSLAALLYGKPPPTASQGGGGHG